jgi:hypothetical protein
MLRAECILAPAWVRTDSAVAERAALQPDLLVASQDGRFQGDHFRGDPQPGMASRDGRTPFRGIILGGTDRALSSGAVLETASAAGVGSTDIRGAIQDFTIHTGGGIRALRTMKIALARWNRRTR